MNNLTLERILNKQNVIKIKIKTKEDFIHLHGNQIMIIFTNQEEKIIRKFSMIRNLSTKQTKKI